MLTIQNVHKAFGAQVVFDGANLQLNTGERYALMGPNGAGKSTLFRMIMGVEEPDGGMIQMPRGVRIGYLPQETAEFRDGTVLQESLLGAFPPEDGVAPTDRDVAEAKKILMGLGFRLTDFERPIGALSGGWRMRVAIARLLLQKPDLMLLDEPTNHLDLESLLWFQEYLKSIPSAILMISHDRAFVNNLVQGILDVRMQKIFRYKGDYEYFLSQRALEESQLVAAYERQQRDISDAMDFINRFRAQASKAPQVQSRLKWLDKLERIEIPPEIKHVKIRFPQPPKSGVRVLSMKNVNKSYGDVKVYENLNFELERGQRVVLAGPNGAGKSTLLKMLAGVLPFESGTRELGLNVAAGYFSQHRLDTLNAERTVLEEATDTRRMNPDLFVRTVLGTFLFRDNAVYKKVKVLSGGEKSRLALARLLLDPPNLLLLDEPTTHLDMASVESLVEALKDYEGTLVFISHDLYFINALADHVVHVEAGRLTSYHGNYEYFQRRRAQQLAESADEEAGGAPTPSVVPSRPAPGAASVGSSSDDVRRLRESEKARQKARKKINARLREIDEELTGYQTEMGSTFIQSDYKKLMDLDASVKALEEEKGRLSAELSAL
jgi:ATP-binding cassette subfamily F protein 3